MCAHFHGDVMAIPGTQCRDPVRFAAFYDCFPHLMLTAVTCTARVSINYNNVNLYEIWNHEFERPSVEWRLDFDINSCFLFCFYYC